MKTEAKKDTFDKEFAVYKFDNDAQVLHIEDIYGGSCKLQKEDLLRFIEFVDIDILKRQQTEGRQG